MPTVDSIRLNQVFTEQPNRPTPIQTHETLLERAKKVLAAKDRQMLELSLSGNVTVRQIARILERPPGTVSRRVRMLCSRLRDPLIAALLDPHCPLSDQYRQLAIEHYAQCRRIRDLARDRQMSLSQVRDALGLVRAWFRGIHANTRRPKSRP